jgi:hypothetical protein
MAGASDALTLGTLAVGAIEGVGARLIQQEARSWGRYKFYKTAIGKHAKFRAARAAAANRVAGVVPSEIAGSYMTTGFTIAEGGIPDLRDYVPVWGFLRAVDVAAAACHR